MDNVAGSIARAFSWTSRIFDAAMSAVAPGSNCGACVVAAGSDLNSIRAVLGPKPFPSKGTMFVTAGSELERQAQIELDAGVSHDVIVLRIYSTEKTRWNWIFVVIW